MSRAAARHWLTDLRSSLGFFTRLPVGASGDAATRPGRVILLAPASGLVLAVLAGLPVLLVSELVRATEGRLLAAVAGIGALAYLTRGLHLDGLADFADGLGSGRDAARSRAVMHKSDIGPFGVIAVLIVVLLQATALAILIGADAGLLGLLVALATARAAISLLAGPNWPAAPGSSLGAWVCGQVPAVAALTSIGLWSVGAGVLGWLLSGPGAGSLAAASLADGSLAVAAWAAGCGALASGTAYLVGRTARQRIGGITGDVFGAAVEVAQTGSLLLLALALG